MVAEKIDRRSEEIVDYVSKEIIPLGKSVRKKSQDWEKELRVFSSSNVKTKKDWEMANESLNKIRDNSNVTYSYAELVHSVYHLSRDEKLGSKELVACILHSYTVYLTQLYRNYASRKREISVGSGSIY